MAGDEGPGEGRQGDGVRELAALCAQHLEATRYLCKLFKEQGLNVADWIRRRRLERCRRDLTDPRRCCLPVHAIAARWGLTDSANFSHAFRTAYGTPPGEYRALTPTRPAVHGETRPVRMTTRTP
ncbi:helix-turn-helix domain-containing protein [Streptomyces sp. NPDC057539]|uniref:helix-turn-helix domain-containing protein n=1 Tax=Streptomyces sp. NPDC057539 TaxID=3346159 RepID=UPI0036B83908